MSNLLQLFVKFVTGEGMSYTLWASGSLLEGWFDEEDDNGDDNNDDGNNSDGLMSVASGSLRRPVCLSPLTQSLHVCSCCIITRNMRTKRQG